VLFEHQFATQQYTADGCSVIAAPLNSVIAGLPLLKIISPFLFGGSDREHYLEAFLRAGLE
jgi:hypothetical protein